MTDQEKREKVIKGLECRLDINGSKYKHCLAYMPTIDAIPVEWLREYDDAFDNVLPISNALRAWEEERAV